MPPPLTINRHLPVVLALGGHDPTGGAGIIADAEAIGACGGWALTIPTALTVQNCRDVSRVQPVQAELIGEMADQLAGIEIAAIKIGLLTDIASLKAVVEIVRRRPGVPVVADPVLKAGGGRDLSSDALIAAYEAQLLPLVDILTPNHHELARLAGTACRDATQRAVSLMQLGCQAVLVTGTDAAVPRGSDADVVHTLHTPDGDRQWEWPRLEGVFHGSGCTLAAALAVRLALGETVVAACEQAQAFTWDALSNGWCPGEHQCLPRRYWSGGVMQY
ncbi:hydroxymethylpyrimidine/phosphomethylpyrimidine kinase [Halomonas sp. 18H]|uniref:bifunctional hydroxymethylpyrimidine kinase/phosphomethylpyrimidine kinase n=1 Tax=Halomonas almeriensis TaxID=308163 RepID=UPI00222E1A83|nr:MULTISPECIES: hydroxymethylpyrimidine/phosphomethylpyrimidine kinase [Halomonas]MCW4152070.1 hydroxymethylpyrimidine/phosphomethylpyrimidine kinase [Halomonas sp. 18H]MDN3552507.1 hydroxymethylpyrimidine/phosphomethylpyrimidine kinase [Halomonas almeriensis]